jgi:hypothetical protein
MDNIESAFIKLKKDLLEYLLCDDLSQYQIIKLSKMLGEKLRININQAKNEVSALKKTFEWENKQDKFTIANTYGKFEKL